MYDGLSCNASRYSMTLDKPWDMPNDGPLFPTNRDVLAYHNRFADKHDIRRHCRFGCRVEEATFDDAKQCWSVQYEEMASGEERTELFSDVIAASGQNSRSSAHIPSELRTQCESAGIPYCHSSAIKQPAVYANKRVLVVGLGVSGSDMAAQLVRHTDCVFIAVRSSQYFMNVRLFGQQTLDCWAGGDLPPLASLPAWMARLAQRGGGELLERVAAMWSAPWEKLGLKRPSYLPSDKVPVADEGGVLRAAVQEGRAHLRNQVRSFSPGKVHYNNATDTAAVNTTVESDDIDSVVFCTGYRLIHPYLPQELAPHPRRPVHIPTGRYPDLGQLTPHTLTSSLTFLILSPSNRHLYFMTEAQAGFAWMIFQQQAKAIVAVLLARREQRERAVRFDRVVEFPNVAFGGPLLHGADWQFRPNDERVVEPGLYKTFLRQFVSWIEGVG